MRTPTLFLVPAAPMALHSIAAFAPASCPNIWRGRLNRSGTGRMSKSYDRRRCRSGTRAKTSSSSSSLRMGAIDFQGSSSSSLSVPLPPDASCPRTRTLPEFLLNSPDSRSILLGAEEYALREDGTFHCPQPGVEWFGLDLVPVFVNSIEGREDGGGVTVKIVEARSDIRGGADGLSGRLVGSLMERSTFVGRNVIAWEGAPALSGSSGGAVHGGTTPGWTLRADLSLTVTVPLPRLAPVPPGFNSIGSRIVGSTCRRRLDGTLVELRDAYAEWARRPPNGEGAMAMQVGREGALLGRRRA